MSNESDSGGSQLTITSSSMDPDDNEYATPSEIWRPISNAISGFDLDPASGAEPTPIASDRYTKEDNGLQKPWYGDVWLNPPWSTNGNGNAKIKWLRKVQNEMNREEVNRIVVILPVDTSTHWFHDYVVDANVICFVGPGRVSFSGESRNPSFNLLVAVYGPSNDTLVEVLNTLGVVFKGKSVFKPRRQQRLSDVGGESEDD